MTNKLLALLLILEVLLASCCEKERYSQSYDFIQQKAYNASDTAIISAIDSAKVRFRLNSSEVQHIKNYYHIK